MCICSVSSVTLSSFLNTCSDVVFRKCPDREFHTVLCRSARCAGRCALAVAFLNTCNCSVKRFALFSRIAFRAHVRQ